MHEMMGGITTMFQLVWIALALVWLLVPFAIFGIKSRLDRIISNQAKAIELQQLSNRWLSESFKQQIGADIPPSG